MLIVETIVTTLAADGAVNCAPMGVEWGYDVIVLKPFLDTRDLSEPAGELQLR